MVPHIENGEACIIVAISTEGRKKAAEIMGTVSLGNKAIKGVAKVREANKDKPPVQEKPPMQKFMEQTPRLISPESSIVKKELVNGRELQVIISNGDIGISIDASYLRQDISQREGTNLALRALRIVKKEVAKMPDGTLLTNTPTTADGLGEARASLYQRAGFGAMSGEEMMSVVKNGKLTPISGDQYRYLMRNKHYIKG